MKGKLGEKLYLVFAECLEATAAVHVSHTKHLLGEVRVQHNLPSILQDTNKQQHKERKVRLHVTMRGAKQTHQILEEGHEEFEGHVFDAELRDTCLFHPATEQRPIYTPSSVPRTIGESKTSA